MQNIIELTGGWQAAPTRIKSRFPNIDLGVLASPGLDRSGFVAHLAETHNLSLTEAQAELEDFLFVEELTREVSSD